MIFINFIKWLGNLPIFSVSHRNLSDKKRDGYEVRMCANCGHEEEMHFAERWCWRCRNGN